MSYDVEITSKAEKALGRLPIKVRRKIAAKIDELATNPRPDGCRKLAGHDTFYRVRVGNYRVVYKVQDQRLVVVVVKVGHRKDIYLAF